MIKFIFEVTGLENLNRKRVITVLPENFFLAQEDARTYLIIEAPDDTSEQEANSLIRRELDRIFFLTGQNIGYNLVLIERGDGRKTILSERGIIINGIKEIPETIYPQQWEENNIELLLNLWYLANYSNIPLSSKINLLFQIIETTCPVRKNSQDYPVYNDSKVPPDPKTESKLLRHLVSHGKQGATLPQLKKYCSFLGIPSEMNDPTNKDSVRAITNRLPIIITEAHNIIERLITKR